MGTQHARTANTKRERRDAIVCALALESRNTRPSPLHPISVRCRIIISIIPDPNYDGINSRPPARKREYQKRGGRRGREREREAGRTTRGNDRDVEEDGEAMSARVGENERGPLKEKRGRGRAPINFSSLAMFTINTNRTDCTSPRVWIDISGLIVSSRCEFAMSI